MDLFSGTKSYCWFQTQSLTADFSTYNDDLIKNELIFNFYKYFIFTSMCMYDKETHYQAERLIWKIQKWIVEYY